MSDADEIAALRERVSELKSSIVDHKRRKEKQRERAEAAEADLRITRERCVYWQDATLAAEAQLAAAQEAIREAVAIFDDMDIAEDYLAVKMAAVLRAALASAAPGETKP